MVSLRIQRGGLSIRFAGLVFLLAFIACWLNSLALPFKAAMAFLICCGALTNYYNRHTLPYITRLNVTANSCAIEIADNNWVSAELLVHYMDGFMLVLKLRCLDAASPQFGRVFWVWLYPGAINQSEQRRLRSFLANERVPRSFI
jgi:hypothetical protein